ncbi:hypothetical protein VTI74DRAFT_6791 [Chaetomium olivicolor]
MGKRGMTEQAAERIGKARGPNDDFAKRAAAAAARNGQHGGAEKKDAGKGEKKEKK